LLIILR